MSTEIHTITPAFYLHKEACEFQRKLVCTDNQMDHGLRFTKFFGRWQKGSYPELSKTSNHGKCPEYVKTDPLLDWLDTRKAGDNCRVPRVEVTNLVCGSEPRLQEACERIAKLSAHERGGACFNLDLVSRLLIGIGLPHPTESGFLFHSTLGVPYVPGTSLKQVAQNMAKECEASTDILARIFGEKDSNGNNLGVGSIAFLDALPTKPVTLTAEQITNHYPDYYKGPEPGDTRNDMQQPADWYDPIPVTLLALDARFSKQQQFQFALVPLHGAARDDVKSAKNWLSQGLEIYGAGARTTLGFGRFLSSGAMDEQRKASCQRATARKKRQEENKLALAKEAEQVHKIAHEKWKPAIGDEVVYKYADDGDGPYIIVKVKDNGDFDIRNDGEETSVSSCKLECCLKVRHE